MRIESFIKKLYLRIKERIIKIMTRMRTTLKGRRVSYDFSAVKDWASLTSYKSKLEAIVNKIIERAIKEEISEVK